MVEDDTAIKEGIKDMLKSSERFANKAKASMKKYNKDDEITEEQRNLFV